MGEGVGRRMDDSGEDGREVGSIRVMTIVLKTCNMKWASSSSWSIELCCCWYAIGTLLV